MRENNDSDKNIKDARRAFNLELSDYKSKAIQEILDLHPQFYNPLIDFDDWNSAMAYLESNRNYVLQLLNKDKNDKKTS